jgi:hypothetical protein
MSMRSAPAFGLLAVLALSAVLPLAAWTGRAQQMPPATITATVYTCPPGVTADTLVPADCSLVTDGFDFEIVSLGGEQTALTLADASFDGISYTWSPGPAAASWFTGVNWGIRESIKPAGYETFDVEGDAVVGWDGRFVTLRITEDAPDAALSVYNFAPANQADAGFLFGAIAVACQERPTLGPFYNGGCVPVEGVTIAFATEDGQVIARCVTAANVPDARAAFCDVEVPFGSTVVVTADESAFPAGYALDSPNPQTWEIPNEPPAGEYGEPIFLALPANALAATEAPTEAPAIEPTATPVEGRSAHVHLGTCDRLRKDPHWDLTDPSAPAGDAEGSRRATAAESSYTVIDVSLADLLATAHAVNVHQSHDAMNVYIVCGEIGGVRRADGSLAVGLREVNGSGYEGIACLTPDASDPSKTDVWVFVAPTLAEEERPTAVPAASPEAGTPVASPAEP